MSKPDPTEPQSNRLAAKLFSGSEDQRSGVEDRRADKRRFLFNAEINVTHVIAAIGIVASVIVGWNLMDKRVVVLEEFRQAQRERDQVQDAISREKFQEVRDALIDLRRSVEKVSDKVGASK